MNLGVIGGGVVGRAIARSYLGWADVRVHDIQPGLSTHSLDETLDSDLTFVALPTPGLPAGGLDLSCLESFFAGIAGSERCLVLKSTVPIGTTRRFRERFGLPNLVHSPEFLTSRYALVDAQIPAQNIIGGHFCECASLLATLYQTRFPGVPLLLYSSDESEAIKLLLNGFFACKISFFNEARALCDHLALDWDRVLAGMLGDGRIAHSHTQVPGPDGRFGAGGSCLPKDLSALVRCIEEQGLSAAVTRAAMERNRLDRERPA